MTSREFLPCRDRKQGRLASLQNSALIKTALHFLTPSAKGLAPWIPTDFLGTGDGFPGAEPVPVGAHTQPSLFLNTGLVEGCAGETTYESVSGNVPFWPVSKIQTFFPSVEPLSE